MKRLILLLSLVVLNACGMSHRMKAHAVDTAMLYGDYAAVLDKMAGTHTATEIKSRELELLDALNSGNALFFLNEHQIAQDVFNHADTKINDSLPQSAIRTASRETMATLNNSSIFDYEPMVIDSLYIGSYKILSALALGDSQGARIEVNRAYARQQEAAEYFSSQIDKANAKAQKEINGLDGRNQSLLSKSTDETMSKYFADLDKWRGYRDYMNPYVTYLSGLFFMVYGQGRSDFENAATYMKRAAGMVPVNSFVKKDLARAEFSADFNSSGKDKYVWIIYENGMIANFEELRIDIPIFLPNGGIGFASFAVPRPAVRSAAFPELVLSMNGQTYRTEILADVDSMFIAEFNRKLPTIISRATAQAVAKSIMQYVANNNDHNGLAGLAATIYALTTSSADLRSWHTLPKNVQIAAIKAGKPGNLTVSDSNNMPLAEIKIPDDVNSIVYIRIPGIMSKLAISVIKLQ